MQPYEKYYFNFYLKRIIIIVIIYWDTIFKLKNNVEFQVNIICEFERFSRSPTIGFTPMLDPSVLSLKVRLRLTTPETKRISIDNHVARKSSD